METQTRDRAYFLDEVATAHARHLDALAGFEVLVEKADREFQVVARDFHDLHTRHAAALGAMLLDAGRTPDHGASFLASVNRGIVHLASVFDDIDEDAMGPIRLGERHVLKALQGALDDPACDPKERQTLLDLKRELEDVLSRYRHLD